MTVKTKPTIEEVRLVLGRVMRAPDTGFTNYAKSYANAALQGQMTGEELKVQILYVLSNLQYWRGEEAREVKKLLKSYAGMQE